jgi:S-formylglutathione hydrolase FrmB
MKRVLLALGVLTKLFGPWCFAQSSDPSDDSKPASSNVPGAEYPRIHSDLRVTFRLKAPDAQKVRLHLDKAGVKHVYYESPGTAHEWQTWRRSLYGFAPLLFEN